MRGEGNHKIPASFAPENMEKTGAERVKYSLACQHEDAIPIKFVPYAQKCPTVLCTFAVALRKESVDRNIQVRKLLYPGRVALRKESVDRNTQRRDFKALGLPVALRKESVDRNALSLLIYHPKYGVALRKESVDRNYHVRQFACAGWLSLSARRAWIEIIDDVSTGGKIKESLSARRAWIEISCDD